jgi:hypothetical protein
LVTRTVQPYPQISGVDPLNHVVEVWDKTGRIVKTLPADARAVQWHASKPATLVWAERGEGADRVLLQQPPFTDAAIEIYRTAETFSGLDWIADSDAALIREYSPSERAARVWFVDPLPLEAPRLLLTRNIDDPVERIGTPVMKTNRWGKSVVAVNGSGFHLRGESADELGARPFLVHVDIQTGAVERVWESAPDGYEEVVSLLSANGAVLLTRRQSAAQPPGIDRRHAPAGLRLVDDIVVIERPDVYEFHGRAAGDDGVRRRSGAACRITRTECERRPEPFPARTEQVAGDVAEEPVVGGDGLAEPGLDAYEVVLKRRNPHFGE